MKKILSYICALILLIFSIFIYHKTAKIPPTPEYPLSAEVINEKLKYVNLDWTVKQEIENRPNVTTYTLYDNENKLICLITSAGNTSEHGLQLSFLSPEYTQLGTSFSTEDWEKAILLSTILYGGFKKETELIKECDSFLKEYSSVSEGSPDIGIPAKWEQNINGITCIIQMQSHENSQFMYLESIRLYNSSEFAPVMK